VLCGKSEFAGEQIHRSNTPI